MRDFNTKVAEGDYSITFETDDRKAFEQVLTLCRILIDGKDEDDESCIEIIEQSTKTTSPFLLTKQIDEKPNLYECDPSKNTECKKDACYINGGECRMTTKKEFQK